MAELIVATIEQGVAQAGTLTAYRKPLVAFAPADDPQFAALRHLAEPTHMLPEDLCPGARSVVSFFLPFDVSVVQANAAHRSRVAREWAVAYVETNALIGCITARLIALLGEWGVRAGAEPATGNFDPETLISRWSHKSVAVVAGLGSFGLHHMVITDAGCAGRFGSLVVAADLPPSPRVVKERCLYFYDGSCRACVDQCPIGALDVDGGIDKQRCWQRCLVFAEQFKALGVAEICGKCAIGPCALASTVEE
ncbi:MAG: epoxyqueuosine reductase [Anaerolineae bacterium]|nr:epoxyqueuosine reductase [Anaerolineae bacterium]